jgi:ribosomal protein L29
MKAKDLRELDAQALETKVVELTELRSRFNVNPDQGLKNCKSYRSVRKEVARIKTVLNEKSK